MTAPISVVESPVRISAEALAPLLHAARGRIDLTVLPECDSSNAELLRAARAGAPAGSVILAERQTAGRGRRGRSWFQADSALAFSLLWRLPLSQAARGLSLAVGLAVADAIGPEAQLKWPNDVLVNGGKAAGILVEAAGAPVAQGDEQLFVIGIGINVGGADGLPADINATSVNANPLQLLARVLDSLVVVLDEFSTHGFPGLRDRWMSRHAWQDMAVNLHMNDGGAPVAGVCRGVDGDGALLLETATCIQTISSGEVSLRLRSES